MKAREAIKNALENVLDAVAGETAVIICYKEKAQFGKCLQVEI